MDRQKRSIIWLTPKQKFDEIVHSSETLAQILLRLGSSVKGGNYKTLKRRLKEEKTNCSHITFGLSTNRGRTFVKPTIPLSDVLVENSTYSRKSLKRRLIEAGLLQNLCSDCGQPAVWNNKILILVLDHINGECDDHRLHNLRLLCPNCNSQTLTFCGRHKTRKRIKD